jgi:phosphoglucosamine mutase
MSHSGSLNRLKSKLFGSSGVRGLANVDLTPVLATRIGLAIVTFSKAKKILVARDTRVSGQMLQDALVSGSLAAGADVACLGVVPTPVLAFLTKKVHADVGVMITASHNPPQYNGIKIFTDDSMAYDEKSQDRIERIIENESFKLAGWQDIGKARRIDMIDLYFKMIKKKVKLNKKWQIIVDLGCGATCAPAPTILKNLGCKVIAVNAQPDGFFPARESEPDSASLKTLGKIVKESGADLGLGYDGDGDRGAFVDEKGNFVDFDRALAAYAAYAIEKEKGGIVVTNVEASMCVDKMVEKQGGKVIRTKVGDVYVSEAMKEHHALFGGEPCGAWIHPQFHYCPDGILSSTLLLKALEEKEKTLSQFISEAPRYPILRESVACKNEAKREIMENTRENLRSVFPKFKDLSIIDGVRLSLENGWVLIRASGTEPLIRLTVEGESSRTVREIMEKSLRLIKRFVEGKQK